MQWYNKPTTILIGFCALSIIIGLATYGFFRASNENEVLSGTERTDRTTGVTVEGPETRTPEIDQSNPSLPILIGFDALINEGIVQSDMYTVQAGITEFFAMSTNYPPRSIVVLADPTCKLPDDEGFVVCDYGLVVNDNDRLRGTLRTNLAGPIDITLFNASGATIFSETIWPEESRS